MGTGQGGATAASGLEGVSAARSSITYVDGLAGELRYRGYSIGDLARSRTFEDVAVLLWDGELPEGPGVVRRALAEARRIDAHLAGLAREQSGAASPLEALRTVLSASSAFGYGAGGNSTAANRAKAVRLSSLVHATVAEIACARAGRPSPETRESDSVARALLRALTGREPSEDEERLFDAILVLHADHEFNASTFAARIVAATEADMAGALTAAVAALQGPKHGGANEDVAVMISALPDAETARIWAGDKLERYRRMTPDERKDPSARFAGFGHRVYKVDDPRAVVLRRMALELADERAVARAMAVAEAVREVVQDGLRLPLNVDYYSAVIYVGLGIEPAMFTSIFAASRVAGWCAHILEQHADNRLIRPRAEYVGVSARSL